MEDRQVSDLQTALKKERDFVSAVLDTVDALVVVLDRQGHIVRFNRACEQTMGYAFDEVEGRCFWDFLLIPEEVEPVRAAFDSLRGGQFPNELENYWVARDGSRRLIAWTNTAIPGPGGDIEYIVGTGLDITGRQQAEEEIRSLSRFPSENPSPVLRLDPTGAILYANEASGALLRDWNCQVGDPAPPLYGDLAAEAFADGAPRAVDISSGEQMYALAVVPIAEAGYVNLYGQDVTERRRAEEALRASEEKFKRLFDILPIGVSILDPKRNVVDANPALETIVGLSREQLLAGEHLHRQYVRKDGTPLPWEEFPSTRAFKEGRVTQGVELGILKEDGQLTWVSVGAAPFALPGLGVATTLVDITVRVQAETERERLLEQTQQDRESIAALARILERERDTLQTIMESTHAQLAYLDPDFNFVRVNSAYARGSGHSREELIGHNHFDLFPDAENQAIFERVRDTGQPVVFHAKPFEYTDQPGRGATYWDWTLVPVKESDGLAHGLVLSLLDVTEEVQARRRIEELAARDEAILNSLAEGIITFDLEGNILTMNPAALRMYGTDRIEEVRRRPEDITAIFKMRHPDGRSLLLEEWPITRVLRGETFSRCEAQVQCLDTGRTWIASYSGTPARDAAGRVTMGVLTLRDITVQKQAEQERERLLAEVQAKNEELQSQSEELEVQSEELRSQAEDLQAQAFILEEERARLQAIINGAPEAILVADECGQVVLANTAAEHLYAAPVPGVIGLGHFGKVIRYHSDHTPVDPRDLLLFRAAVHGETHRDVPMALLWPDGQWRDVLASAVPILDDRGQAHGAVGIYLDITERVRSEEALRETRDYLDSLLTYANAPIIVWDPDFKITRFNGAFERLTGLKAGDVCGRELDILFPEERKEEAMAHIRRAVAGERWEVVEIPIQRVDGTVRTVLWNSATLYAADGATVIATIAQGQDITERVQTEAELKAALAEKEVLMREIYHRVKNNLQALIYLMDMQADHISDESTRQMIRELQERARAMALVHEKLYQSHNLAQVDFGDYLHDLVDNLSHAFGTDRPVACHVNAESVLLSVDTAIPCGLIVTELLTNALKYAFPGAQPCVERGETECHIDVEFRAEGDQFTLVVADNGVGLPPGLDWRMTRSLGMQLINVLAQHQLGGQVEVDARAGTSFKITLAERRKR